MRGDGSSGRAEARQAIVILADGARADVFERLLDAGQLPEIANHVVARGGYKRAVSTFTSTTIPAHLPFLTGCFAGTANIPGYRWFDREAWRPGLPTGPWCLRSYNGMESLLVDRDIAGDRATIFELTREPINIFGAITRGLPKAGNLYTGRKNRLWLRAHYRHDYVSADDAAREALVTSLDCDQSELRFAVMPGIDWNSHYIDPLGTQAEAAYRRVDACVGAVADRLRRLGRYEQTLIVVCSDHGHCRVDEHFDLAVRMERDHGLRVAYHSVRAWRRNAEAICCVSGNAMAHLYLRPPGHDWRNHSDREQIDAAAPGLISRLLNEPAVDLVVTRTGNWLLVESARGQAMLRECDRRIEYRVTGSDPFNYNPLPPKMTFDDALGLSYESEYPDALLQIAQLFRSRRTGDLVVSAAPGFDLRERYESPEHRSSHGALHGRHMHVPLAVSEPLTDAPARTADVFASLLDWLGRDHDGEIDGVSRLLATAGSQSVATGRRSNKTAAPQSE